MISFIRSPDRSRNAPRFPHKIPSDSFSIADFSAKYNASGEAGQRIRPFGAGQTGLRFPQQGHCVRRFRRVGVAAGDDLLFFLAETFPKRIGCDTIEKKLGLHSLVQKIMIDLFAEKCNPGGSKGAYP